MNRFLYKEQFAYTLKETFAGYLNENEGAFNWDEDGIYGLMYDSKYSKSYPLEPSFIINKGTTEETYDPLVETILQKVLQRYAHHYFYIKDTEGISNPEAVAQFSRLMRVVDYTFPKYSTLLKLYEDNKTHLMDKLASLDSETSSNSETRSNNETHSTSQSEQHADIIADERKLKMNDTPQTEDVNSGFEADQYVSELHKEKSDHSQNGNSSITGSGTITGGGSTTGSGTITRNHSSDPTTIMERISEIQNKYQNLMLKWLNEFDKLFIEEGNI